jgi:hypothetical protein
MEGGSARAPGNLELAEYNSVRNLHTRKFLLIPSSYRNVALGADWANSHIPIIPVYQDLSTKLARFSLIALVSAGRSRH